MRIHLHKVSKRFDSQWIFKDVSASYQSGNAYAITGHNGSGKSTLLKILSGHVTPTSGELSYTLNEQPLKVEDLFAHISYTAPYLELIEDMTLPEHVNFHQQFKAFLPGVSASDVINMLGFEADKLVRNYSSGMKQRLKLVLAILSNSQLVLLDEPTANFDEQGIGWYKSLIEQYTKDRLVIVSSAQKEDFDFCREVLDIRDYK